MQAIISALGTGIHEEFDIDKLRYHKVVLMADADVDGHHINTLLLTLLFRFMRPLIEQGYVYMAQPPLYRIRWNKPARARVRLLRLGARRPPGATGSRRARSCPRRTRSSATRASAR